MSQTLLLRPFDKLFVKDGRPLSLEDDSAASGLFPPPPSVYYGALRSAQLSRQSDPVGAIGTEDDPAQGGVLLEQAFAKTTDGSTALYFPAPFDLIRRKEKNKAKAAKLTSSRLLIDLTTPVGLTSSPTPALLRSSVNGAVESVGGYISGAGLSAYLAGENVTPAQRLAASELHHAEPKLGIALDYHSRTTGDGMLYTMAMQRLHEGVELCVRTAGFGESPQILRLGAEARAVQVSPAKHVNWPKATAPSGITFTLYLATPAVFKNGWLPDFLSGQEREYSGELGGAQVRLLAASVGKYVPLGGWDIVARRPKPMRKAVPAGTAYHFEITNGDFDVAAVHGKALHSAYQHSGLPTGDHLTYPQQGFGIAYVGRGPQTFAR